MGLFQPCRQSPTILDDDRYENEFGVVYRHFGPTFGEAQERPLAHLENVRAYRLPDFSARFAEMEQVVRNQPDPVRIPEENTKIICETCKTFGWYPFRFQTGYSQTE